MENKTHTAAVKKRSGCLGRFGGKETYSPICLVDYLVNIQLQYIKFIELSFTVWRVHHIQLKNK